MNSTFSNRLKEARAKAGLTQSQVAEAIGIHRSSYALYETGRNTPTMARLEKIALKLNVSVDYLLGVNPEEISKAFRAEREEVQFSPNVMTIAKMLNKLNRDDHELVFRIVSAIQKARIYEGSLKEK